MTLNEKLLKLHFLLTFVSVNMIFAPQFILGVLNIPRRYVDFPDMVEIFNTVSSFGYVVSLVSVLVYMYGMVAMLFSGSYQSSSSFLSVGLEDVSQVVGFHRNAKLVCTSFLFSMWV